MSLIADALKKVQSAKLGRRYLSSYPSGMLPGIGERKFSEAPVSLRSALERIQLSPTLLVGLGAGILLFVMLFAYFLYGSGPKAKSPTTASSGALEKRPGLILVPPPSAPAVEPLILGKGEPRAKEPGSIEKETPLERARERQQTAGSEDPSVKRTTKEQARLSEQKKRSEGSKVTVDTDPSEEARYHFNLALLYQEERKFPLARRAYERVVQIWPLYAEAHNNLGVVYKELGMYEQAIAELKKALALNPRYPRAYHNLGVIYQINGDWKEATRNYERALSLDRNQMGSYNNLGLVYRSQGRPHEAREVLEKALAISPHFPQTHYNLALVLEEVGEVERARFHYQKFVEQAGEHSGPLAEKVRAHLQEMAAK